MRHRDTVHWEGVAQREPYFPVLDADGAVQPEFFASGEADIAALIAAINELLSSEVSLDSVLDFGCGAGRLSLPLATRAVHVTGCDIAPTMLAHARKNALEAGAANVEFVLNDALKALPDASFSFICSLCVFQYVGAADGYRVIRELARLLAPGGVAAIQLRFGTTPTIRRYLHARESGSRSAAHANVYNERHVVAALMALGVETIARLPLTQTDSVLIVRRPAR